MSSNQLILCRPLLLPPSIFPSIRIFSNESVLHSRWPKYWNFSLRIIFPVNIQDWFPPRLTGWVFLQPKGLSRVFSNTTVQKNQFFSAHLRNTLLCILHLFPFQHFPPAQPQCCLSFRSLYAVNLMKTDLLHFNMSSLSFVYGVWWRWWCFWCSGRHFQLSVNVDSLFFLWNEPSWIICLPNLPCRWDGHFETMPHRVNRTWNLNRNPWVCLTEQ